MTVDAAVPQGYRVRTVTDEDLPTIVALCSAADMVDWGAPDVTADMIRQDWRLPGMDLGSNAWIIESSAGAAVGYGWIHTIGELPPFGWGVVHPEHRGRGLGALLVSLRDGRGAELVAGRPPRERRLQIALIEPDRASHELVERRGYGPVRHFWDMQILISDVVPKPEPPPGLSIRAFVKGEDDRAVHAALDEAFADHWQHHSWSFEEWADRRFGTSSFDPSLWFLAEDGEEMAGAALCSISDGVGWVDSLGVRRQWRRRGLGERLLLHSFSELSRRGIADVRLGVDSANPTGATRLYERVGMHVHRQYDVYEKRVGGAGA